MDEWVEGREGRKKKRERKRIESSRKEASSSNIRIERMTIDSVQRGGG